MVDPIMYQEDGFVILEPDQPEKFLTKEELLAKLIDILQHKQDDLPRDLQKFNSIEAQAKHLMETSCELDIAPGEYLEWYVVRFDK